MQYPSPELSLPLGSRYVQYINRTYRRTGTLWGSRYKSSLIQADNYLLSCQCCIELNPVRTAMVDDPAHYRWTSYRHNALGQANPYLSPHSLYLALGKNDKTRQATYRRLFRTELDDEAISDIRLAFNQNQPLGNSRFYAKIEAMTGQCQYLDVLYILWMSYISYIWMSYISYILLDLSLQHRTISYIILT